MEKVSFFKCISGEQAILDTIQRGTAKLTQLSQSNDPMEFRPCGNENSLQEWYIWYKDKQPLVLCLSAKFSSPPMWAHYADNHKGAAVVFEFDILESYKILLPEELATNGDFLYIHKTKQEYFLVKCVYSKNRSIVPKCTSDLQKLKQSLKDDRNKVEQTLSIAMIRLIAAKGSEWAYENEYRLVFPENDLFQKEGLERLITTKFQDNISAILVGYKNDFEGRIKNCAKSQKKKLPIRSVRCSSESFEMVCKQITDSVRKLEAIEQEAQLKSWVELAEIMR